MSDAQQNELKRLVVSQAQADFIRSINVLLTTLDSGTLAEGWCVLNARKWPRWQLEVPAGHEDWAHKYLLGALTEKVPKSVRLSTWRRCRAFIATMARDDVDRRDKGSGAGDATPVNQK